MKTVFSFFILTLLMLVSCNKELLEEEPLTLKKAYVPVPMKADFCASPDMSSPMLLVPIPGLDPANPKNYMPSRMFVSGNATHLGQVDPKNSLCDVTEFTFFVDDQGNPFLSQIGTGTITAANGDYYHITWWVKTSLPGWTYIGEAKIIDGTGKFYGATGTVSMVGKVDLAAGTNCWTGDGSIIFSSDH